jgi:hypothetical protein
MTFRILRYKKKPMDIDWGGAIGGGNPIYYGTADKKWKNRLDIAPWNKKISNNWFVKSGGNSLRKFFSGTNLLALRGERWRIFIYLTSGNILGAVMRFYREILKKIPGYFNEYSGAWETNAEILESTEEKIKIRGFLARRDGTRFPGVEITREYAIKNDVVELRDVLSVVPEKLKNSIKYVKGM